jgi:hemerythrin-like domain-containing protein
VLECRVADHDRAAALSRQLIDAHRALRDRLQRLRGYLIETANLTEAAQLSDAVSGLDDGQPSSDLLMYCAGFCAAVQRHHTGEDGRLLPLLRHEYPDLAPVIDNLIEDHQLIADILRKVATLAAQADAGAPTDPLVRELDGLAAILDSHFGYEERRIAAALDAVGAPAWVADVFTVDHPEPHLQS